MALDWSRASRRKSNSESGSDAALMRIVSEPKAPQPSKADLRAESEAAIAAYRGAVTRLPTMIDLRCVCGRTARIAIAPDRARPRFRCSRCGTRV